MTVFSQRVTQQLVWILDIRTTPENMGFVICYSWWLTRSGEFGNSSLKTSQPMVLP